MRRARGFSLVSAIFVMVVLGLIVAFMLKLGTTTREVSTMSIRGARAHFAAVAGLERGVHAVLGGSCVASSAFAVEGFAVTLACQRTDVTEGAATYPIYALQATATAGPPGSVDFVSRSVDATVTDPP